MRSEVLVVGAGPTGLTVACQLRRLGVSVRIVDKKAGFSTTSKAIGLQYRVSEILACMGVVDRFLAEGGTPTAVNIFVRDRRLVQLKFVASGTQTGRDAFQPRAIVIPQSETEQLLGDLLTELGGLIEWNCEFLGFEQDARGVRDFIVLPVMRSEFVQRKLFAKLAQLHVNYRGDTLSRHDESISIRTVLKAGDRAPDVAFRERDKVTTLFELLRPFRPIALARFEGKTSQAQIDRIKTRLRVADITMYGMAERDSDSPSDPDCLIDIYGDFARLYGMRAEFLCVIRPDDHIGLFQSPIDEDAIADYVTRISAS